jgi:glutamine phosphoribosylpyrophosphate amidotransferase
MCIIIYKPKGRDLSRELEKNLITSHENNFDGCGFMHNGKDEKEVTINKGFMCIEELFDALKTIDAKNKNIVFHFRYATHGEILPENCHPFPVTENEKELRQLEISCDAGIAHNGVISFCSDKKSRLSDSQIFIKDYLSKLSNSLENPALHELIVQWTESKFVIMTNDKVYLLGDFIKDKGIFYSNTSYKRREYSKIKSFLQCECCGKFITEKDPIFYKYDFVLCEYCSNFFDEDF